MKILAVRGGNLASLTHPFDIDFTQGRLGDSGLLSCPPRWLAVKLLENDEEARRLAGLETDPIRRMELEEIARGKSKMEAI